MKKINLIEAIQKNLPNKVHPGTLEVYIGRAFNQIIYETFRKDISNLDLYSKTYTNVEVKKDEIEGVYYCVIPVAIVQLPSPGDGIRSISTMQGRGVEFVPNSNSLQRIHEDLEVRDVSGPIPFMVTNNRIEFGDKSPMEDISKVKISLVPQFEALSMTDEVYIPSGKDEQLMELVTKFASTVQPGKEINDQSQKTR